MPLGDELDELLSGYIDGRLNREERQRVESVLPDPSVQARLQQLRDAGESLRFLAAQSQSRLSSDFTSRVVAVCGNLEREPTITQQQYSSSGSSFSPLTSSSTGFDSTSRQESIHGGSRRWSGRHLLVRAASAALGVAALVFLAVWLPQWFSDPAQPLVPLADRDSQKTITEETKILADPHLLADLTESDDMLNGLSELLSDSIPPIDRGRMAAERGSIGQIQYALVLDVELSHEARDQKIIKLLFEKYGISSLQSLQANANIEQAINRMRFTVQEQPKGGPAEIFLVRAPAPVLDMMLSEIQAEVEQFPAYRFDLAFQTPTLSLSQAIADAIGESDSLAESFALSLVSSSGPDGSGDQDWVEGSRISPFDSIPYQGNLVSTRRRQERIESPMEFSAGNDLSFLLLLVR